MADVRERALEVLDELDLDDPANPVLRAGFAHEMLIAHEHQHNETMLQLLQMVDGYEPPLRRPGPARAGAGRPGDGRRRRRRPRRSAHPAPASPTTTSDPRHQVEIAPFRIDRLPVSNADFAAFVAETGAEPPLYWERDGAGGWVGDDLRQARRARSGRPRWSTSTIARRPPSPSGPASGCRPSSSGRPPPRAPIRRRQPRSGGLRPPDPPPPGSESGV